jgi:hypothetical protein
MPPGKAFDHYEIDGIYLAAIKPIFTITDMAVPGPLVGALPYVVLRLSSALYFLKLNNDVMEHVPNLFAGLRPTARSWRRGW